MKPDLRVVEAAIESKRDIDGLIARMRDAGLTDVLVLGYDKDGSFWSDINFVCGPDAIWLLEKAKHHIMSGSRP